MEWSEVRKILTAVLSAAMVATSLAMAPTAHADTGSATIQSGPMKLERFSIQGEVRSGFARPIQLQRKEAKGWRTISSGRTAVNGSFRFTASTAASSVTLRAFLPRASYRGRVFAQLGTSQTVVRTVSQTAGLAISDAVAGRAMTAVASSTPVRPGRGVELQKLSGGSWRTIASGAVGSTGRGTFRPQESTAGTYTYRTLMSGWNGAGRMGSAPVTVKVAAPIRIPDKKLLACIDSELGLKEGTPITPAEARTLQELECEDGGISSLEGLQSFTSLGYLDVWNGHITSLEPIQNLTTLQVLLVDGNDIADISPLARLRNLKALDIGYNPVEDLSVLFTLNLQGLGLSGLGIQDISALKNLPKLTLLDLSDNAISDITALAALTRLDDLYLDYNQISDISALRGLSLEELSLVGNPICTSEPQTRGCTPPDPSNPSLSRSLAAGPDASGPVASHQRLAEAGSEWRSGSRQQH